MIGGSVYNQMNFRWQLAVYDRQTGRDYTRTSRWGSAFRPTLSPDGRWLVELRVATGNATEPFREGHTGERYTLEGVEQV